MQKNKKTKWQQILNKWMDRKEKDLNTHKELK